MSKKFEYAIERFLYNDEYTDNDLKILENTTIQEGKEEDEKEQEHLPATTSQQEITEDTELIKLIENLENTKGDTVEASKLLDTYFNNKSKKLRE